MSDVATPVESTVTASEDVLRRQAYSAATTRLRAANRSEFDGYVAEEMKARGIDWQPRLTDEQKAEQVAADLFSKFPDLRAKFVEAPSEA